MFESELDGIKRKVGSSYANRVSPFPDDNSLTKDYVIDRYLVKGLMPETPFVTQETPIVAFGSCFASNISKHLHARGYNVVTKREGKSYVTRMGDGMTHTAAIRQQFEWAWENKFPSVALWHGYDAEEFGYAEDARLETKALFDEAEVFIITLGLSEIWYDEPTGEVFWRVPPKGKMDPERHKFRVATFAETKGNIAEISRLIRTHRPGAKIVLTVSPIPLAASFRAESCLSANAASKAIVRAAVDEFYRDSKPTDPNLYYFPSYDIVTQAFNHQYLPDRRHINAEVLAFNMKIFERYFCSPGISADELLESLRKAQAFDNYIRENGQASIVDLVALKTAKRLKARTERVAARQKAKLEQYGVTSGEDDDLEPVSATAVSSEAAPIDPARRERKGAEDAGRPRVFERVWSVLARAGSRR